MNQAFMCSLCHNGILGGVLYLESQSVIYRTNKLTVDKKFRNLVLPVKDIKEILRKILYQFPVKEVTITLPAWINSLPLEHPLRAGLNEAVKTASLGISKSIQSEVSERGAITTLPLY